MKLKIAGTVGVVALSLAAGAWSGALVSGDHSAPVPAAPVTVHQVAADATAAPAPAPTKEPAAVTTPAPTETVDPAPASASTAEATQVSDAAARAQAAADRAEQAAAEAKDSAAEAQTPEPAECSATSEMPAPRTGTYEDGTWTQTASCVDGKIVWSEKHYQPTVGVKPGQGELKPAPVKEEPTPQSAGNPFGHPDVAK